MAWLKKKTDVISDRARALNDEIAALESQIKELDTRLQRNQSQPRLRSTTLPHGTTLNHTSDGSEPATFELVTQEPIFEDVDRHPLEPHAEAPASPAHYNELGVRKYDLAALLRRLRIHLRGPSTTNPKLVSYLAAGGIQGLRPMRYEKRVARNRFIALVVILFMTLLGIILVFSGHGH